MKTIHADHFPIPNTLVKQLSLFKLLNAKQTDDEMTQGIRERKKKARWRLRAVNRPGLTLHQVFGGEDQLA